MTSSSPGRQGGTGRPSSGTAIGLIAVPLLAAALLAAPAPRAQDEGHVVSASALISRSAVAPGETFKAAVIVKVRAGYHINDNAPLDEFMVPTTLTVADHPDFEVAGFVFPRGRRARFSFAESELAVYEGEVVLGVLLKAKEGAAPGPKTLEAEIGYQACDDASCLPPKELALSIAVPVAAAGGSDVHPEIFDKLRFPPVRKPPAP